jgi:tRNA(Ile)-lysidine synthase
MQSFLNYIKKKNLFSPGEKTLLTVSGGIDSVAMCELFHSAGLLFGIAHCNFQLRDAESDKDEEFVEQLAANYNVPFHSTTFKTSAYAKKNKLSIQVAARELRYKWFEEIRNEHNYNAIATAHHLDDSIETFFINFVRGTGISGLHGILPKQGAIVRPLLFATKQKIQRYAKKHKLSYREDSSNASDKYTRNKIRHHIIPLLKELNPNFEKTAAENLQHLIEVEAIYKNEIESKRAAIVKSEANNSTINIRSLKKLHPLNAYLFEFLKPFQFNSSTVNEIITSLDGEPGKQFFSSTHRLVKDREVLLIQQLSSKEEKEASVQKFEIKEKQKKLLLNNLEVKFKTLTAVNYQRPTTNSIATLDLEKLKFPLEIRKWQKGDTFYPLGMKGKKKKLSDFFIDTKLSLYQKENTWLLISEDKIAWIIGLRIDDRFKVTDKTRKIYQLELLEY